MSFRHIRNPVKPAIGSDFIWAAVNHMTRCSECEEKIPAGTMALVSIRNEKVQKRVCSEDCRLEFDSRFWQGRARERRLKENA